VKSLIAGALVIMAGVSACASDETVSVCDALRRRNALHTKLVAVRGLLVATDEGGWLLGRECGEAIMINGRAFRSAIWLEMSGASRRAAGVWSTDLDASIKAITLEMEKRRFNAQRDRLWVTYTGVFEAYDDESNHALRHGFGHLNAAPAQLIVKEIRDAVVEQAPKPPEK
jgi:hypothetical protein